jgi:hypothetical protein
MWKKIGYCHEASGTGWGRQPYTIVMMRRFLFLGGLVLVLAFVVACNDAGGSVGTPTATEVPATPTASPTPSPLPTPSPTPTPSPAVDLALSRAIQGGFLVVRLVNPPPGTGPLTAYFNGAAYPMVNEGDHWQRVIGLAPVFTVGEYPVEVSSADSPIAAGVLRVNDGGYEFISIELPPSSIALASDQAAAERERARLAAVYATFSPQQVWSGPWIWPAQGEISNSFGLQRSINGGAYAPHTGTDIANAKGTPVVAAASGTVALAETLHYYGNAVVIDHGTGVFTSYNHLDSIAVAAGQPISAGDLVGYMGETGFVSGPHVHWEAVIGGERTDPMLWTEFDIDP